MKQHKVTVLILLSFSFPTMPFAQGDGSSNPVHKYWVCGISSYYSLVGGKRQEGKCRANTEYSEPHCREFVVEFEGDDGVRPGAPFKRTNQQDNPATTTSIEINKGNGRYVYAHIVEETGDNSTNKWVYNGKCKYYEAPLSEKIYMQKGLTTIR